ncbi:MAG: signal peptide peptidase SppA [Planctomycetaceae bacterium]|nr:signal peptide peptidase SppA [Planctomycetaceae bacterium]
MIDDQANPANESADYRTPRPYHHPTPDRGFLGNTVLQSCLVAGCVTVFVPVLLIGGFMLVMYFALSSSLDSMESGSFSSLVQSSASEPNLRERVLRTGASGAGTIAVVTVHGAIDGNGSPLDGTGSLGFVSQQLRAAARSSAVKAVILQIDSPGGGLTASDLLHHEVELLRQRGKPVIAWAGSTMASGGYYIAVAAESIMASPTTTIGSIGVIMQHFQVQEMLAKLGIRVDPVTSGAHKDLGSPFREMTPEERRILENYIAVAHARFVGIVAEGRDLPPERVREMADGSIFVPAVALERGLIDSIGYIEDAVAWVEDRIGESNMRIIGYRRQLSIGDLFNEAGAGAAGAAVRAAREETTPQTMAVWDGR